MSKLTIYEKPTCRQTMMILKESEVVFEAINYYIDPIPKKELKELLTKMKLSLGRFSDGIVRNVESIQPSFDSKYS